MAFNDVVYVENTGIRFTNFAGEEGTYNPAGRRNFMLDIPEERVEEMRGYRLNIKESKPDSEGRVQHYIKVNVNYNPPRSIPKPRITLFLDNTYTELDESEVAMLDSLDIVSVDCSFRLYKYNDAGDCSAKLSEMLVYARESYISARRRAMIESRCAEE